VGGERSDFFLGVFRLQMQLYRRSFSLTVMRHLHLACIGHSGKNGRRTQLRPLTTNISFAKRSKCTEERKNGWGSRGLSPADVVGGPDFSLSRVGGTLKKSGRQPSFSENNHTDRSQHHHHRKRGGTRKGLGKQEGVNLEQWICAPVSTKSLKNDAHPALARGQGVIPLV